ncbi:hypothetical protein Ndes2526B_g02324 [Nannochloris sp. 'desiccata']|nr:hypothetical protein KSW81_003347 [Chlorella desiccata (nom. nud.)]
MADTPRSDIEDTMSEHVHMPLSHDGDEREVSQSLVGLMGAFENLKQAVGYSAAQESEEFAEFQHFIQEMEAENTQLRMHAVEAIQVAERLREENSTLLDEMTQAKLDDMVEQSKELDKVVLEYDQEVMEARVAEADAVLEEVAELRSRVSELEEENTGLSEMLNEMRQSQQQLVKLQAMEQQQAIEGQGESIGAENNSAEMMTQQHKGLSTPVGAGLVSAAGAGAAASVASAARDGADAESSSPSFMTAEPGPDELTPTQPPSSHEKSAMLTTPGSTRGASKDPVAVAEALSAVAGSAEGGVAATAARMLRDYAAVQLALEQERASKKELQVEVDRLDEIISSKTFKAPSAWAEREVKYKQEREKWEESRKEAELKMSKMKVELDSLRCTSGAAALERRIEELEARLLESKREHTAAKASLHEMELASRASVGEFSLTGVKPYSGPKFSEQGEVHQAISNIESSGGTPTRVSPRGASGLQAAAAVVANTTTPGGGASVSFNPNLGGHDGELHATPPRVLGGDEEVSSSSNMAAQQIATLQRENTRLKAQLEKAGLGVAGAAAALETPQVVRQAMNSTTAKKAKDLEDQLAITQQERAELLKELETMKEAAAARGAEEAQRVTLQLRIAETEARTEVALLQHGVDAESARSLAALTAQLQDAQQREETALAKLQEMKAVSLTINVSSNASPANPAAAATAKKEMEQEEEILEEQVHAMQVEQEKLQDQIKEVAVAATVSQKLLSTPAIRAGETSAESLSDDIAGFLAEAAAASNMETLVLEDQEKEKATMTAAGELPAEAVDRISSLQTQLKAAEQALAALEKGVAPIQMHISVAGVAAQQQKQDATVQKQRHEDGSGNDAVVPVQMRIAVNEGPSETMVKVPITLLSGEEAVASIRMPINISNTAAVPVLVAPAPINFSVNVSEVPEAPVHLPITVGGETRNEVPVKFAFNVAETAAQPPQERQHLSMPINISGSDAGTAAAATATTAAEAPVRMAINIAGDQAAPIQVPLNISGGMREPSQVKIPITIATDPIKEKRMKQLEEMLKAANEEEERLRRDLEALVPVKLNFSLAGEGGGGAAGAVGMSPSPHPVGTGMSRRSSAASFEYSAEGLAQDRAAVEAAWEDHVKSTDVPSLMRAKAELETQCQMLQQKLDKLQAQLEDVGRENVQIHESIEDAVRSGDVGILSGLRDGLKSSKTKVISTSRSFKVFGKKKEKGSGGGGGVSSKETKSAMHDTQDALHQPEVERNVLQRHFDRMSKKKEKGSSKTQAAVAAGGTVVVGGAAGLAAVVEGEEGHKELEQYAGSEVGSDDHEDVINELGSLRNENGMLMEHLVTTKVRLAEVEGDYLESRRALLRSREKQMQLARQIMELQALEEPVHQTTKLDMTPPASARGEQQDKPAGERRRSLRLPGLG